MRRTGHGFALAGRPSVRGAVQALMAAWAVGASSLCPAKPSGDVESWVDRRDLAPILPARVVRVFRKWWRVKTKGNQKTKTLRWKITPHLEQNAAPELKRVRLTGEAITLPDGGWIQRSWVRLDGLDAVLNHMARVRLELIHKGKRCTR